MMKRTMLLLLAATLVSPAAGVAQQRRTDCCSRNPFSFTPYVGVMKDAYDLEADGSDTGLMLGFRAGYHETQRLSFGLNLAYAQTNDVATRGIEGETWDNQWVFLTGGLDFVLVPGNTSVAVGADAGVAWRNTDYNADTGIGVPRGEGWGTYDLLVPSLTLRHHFSPSTSVALSLRDHIFDILEGDVQHSPALTLGLSFR